MAQTKNYLLRIKLMDIEPEIWRRFVVPGTIKLSRLHDVIQIIMGWQNRHLHNFSINDKYYTLHPDPYFDMGVKEHDSHNYSLSQLIRKKGKVFQYYYDFGDDWVHEIIVEDDDYLPGKAFDKAYCVEGENACPPEDCGGPFGFYDFCQAIEDPNHEEHEECVDWYRSLEYPDKKYDPKKFDIKRVNKQLDRLVLI